MKRTEIDYNKIYYNSKGKPFKVIKEVEPKPDINGQLRRRIMVRFESGYETEVHLSILNNKSISLTDYLSPTVCGIGMLGYAGARENFNMYKRWCDMIYRCYDPNNQDYANYGAKGVYVCNRWLRFDYYLEDVVKLPGYEDMINNPDIKYHLDKDTLQQGCKIKVYSPETCIWIPETINSIQKSIDNKANTNNTYFGVIQNNSGNFAVRISINGRNFYPATFTNEEAAASAYDHYAFGMSRPTLNGVIMTQQEFTKYLARPIQMLVDENKFHGVQQLPYGNYRVVICVNGDRAYVGIYTLLIAAANVYNHFCFANGKPIPNKVPYMSPAECRQYMVKPRIMCDIIN
jgi:hypothetical protein